MAQFLSDIPTALAASLRVKPTAQGGRVRFMESSFLAGATNPQVGDTIKLATLPVGARLIPHLSRLDWSAGTAGCTLSLGDAASAARYLPATAVTGAGTAGITVPANGALDFESSNGSNTATDDCALLLTVAGAVVAVGQRVTLRAAYVVY
jgi:hypothetical protein